MIYTHFWEWNLSCIFFDVFRVKNCEVNGIEHGLVAQAIWVARIIHMSHSPPEQCIGQHHAEVFSNFPSNISNRFDWFDSWCLAIGEKSRKRAPCLPSPLSKASSHPRTGTDKFNSILWVSWEQVMCAVGCPPKNKKTKKRLARSLSIYLAGTPEAVSAANAPSSYHAGIHHPKPARHWWLPRLKVTLLEANSMLSFFTSLIYELVVPNPALQKRLGNQDLVVSTLKYH